MKHGQYHNNPDKYGDLVDSLCEEYKEGIKLPPEYAFFFKENLLSFLIRLSRYKFVAKQLNQQDQVLEISCGSGVGSIFISQFYKKVTGIDVKNYEIQEAISINKRENVEYLVKDFFDIEHNRKFDVIVALDVIEHLTDNEANKFIENTRHHLTSCGLLVIGTPSIHSSPYQGPLSQASHVKCYDQPELIELMQKFYDRCLSFSMNDELVHTGNSKMAWYYFVMAFYPRNKN